ncbi:hypothetical protein [Pseudomonas sp. MEJ086]|uniref:hypothetical protein n=1 Tax=Pseudomonas sp. MEJ086 TaxID=3040319 RepID=UPI002556900B|nr:hypothetical protein [Pseudomonas sp. MEJ086]
MARSPDQSLDDRFCFITIEPWAYELQSRFVIFDEIPCAMTEGSARPFGSGTCGSAPCPRSVTGMARSHDQCPDDRFCFITIEPWAYELQSRFVIFDEIPCAMTEKWRARPFGSGTCGSGPCPRKITGMARSHDQSLDDRFCFVTVEPWAYELQSRFATFDEMPAQ